MDDLTTRLSKANQEIQTIPIERYDKKKDKTTVRQYSPVSERVRAFRKVWPLGKILTEIDEDTGARIKITASVFDDNGSLLATGHAFEDRDSSLINRSSYIENCETSAVGRALAFCGIGVDAGIASAEETDNALIQQDAAKKAELEKQPLNAIEAAAFEVELDRQGIDPAKILAYYRIPDFEHMTLKKYRAILDDMKKAREIWGKDEQR